jgi:hypothetical protein
VVLVSKKILAFVLNIASGAEFANKWELVISIETSNHNYHIDKGGEEEGRGAGEGEDTNLICVKRHGRTTGPRGVV